MDWSTIGPLVAQAAPTIGSLLGGLIPFPGGAVLGQVAGKILAEALGVPPTPEAVNAAITTGDPATVNAALASADAKMQMELEKHKADLADVQDARSTNLELVKAGSSIGYAPIVVSLVILAGFLVLSFLAMKPDLAGVRTDVTLFLLGSWSGYTAAVVTYWLGSSAGSADKAGQLAAIAARTPAPPAAKSSTKR
ncbi:MAG: hypothetical protein J0H71_05595 [Rhizobiales bacterium]|nr:hypothetical protein [Hyphomicrobiales bacterium]